MRSGPLFLIGRINALIVSMGIYSCSGTASSRAHHGCVRAHRQRGNNRQAASLCHAGLHLGLGSLHHPLANSASAHDEQETLTITPTREGQLHV
jgi:hypothetical protein